MQYCVESRTGRLGFVIFLKEMVSYSSQASARQGVHTARVGLLFASKITWKKLKFESAESIAFQGMIIMTVESGLVKEIYPRHSLLNSRKMRSINKELRIGRW